MEIRECRKAIVHGIVVRQIDLAYAIDRDDRRMTQKRSDVIAVKQRKPRSDDAAGWQSRA